MKGRKSFAKLSEVYELPYLLNIQIDSYRNFLQLDRPKTKQDHKGLLATFLDTFPIESFNGEHRLEFLSHTLGKPDYDSLECQKRGMTYAAPLKMRVRLRTGKEIKEQEVYLCDLPLMTDTGTFIINGDERVVVSQLHRSPGISFEKSLHSTGKTIYCARIIPYHGAWVEFEFDANDILHVYIDRRRKVLATTLLRAVGLSKNEEILKAICGIESISPVNKPTLKRFIGATLAVDLKDSSKQGVIAKCGEKITPKLIEEILKYKITKITVVKTLIPEIINTLERDRTSSREEALIDIHRRLRPGNPPTKEAAEGLIHRLFFDPKRYNLGSVGRYILNRKLGMNTPLTQRVLDTETLVQAIKSLNLLKNGERVVDDIDHLGNRRVRTVGELLQNQFRIAFSRLEKSVKERMAIYEVENIMPHNIINSKLISSLVRDFFGRSQLSQFMDQTNPLAELTHKRRLSALGPGGLSRERAGFEVRDVHHSHYGRICPVETPEGPNIGLIASLGTYARVNEFGFLETPYRKVEKSRVTNKIDYLSADIEDTKKIAQANARIDKHGRFMDEKISCRFKGDFPLLSGKQIDYMDVSPRQLVSIATCLIPFLEHDDANRALMGSNMQRQSVPLLEPEAPLVGTGMEHRAAKDSGVVVVAKDAGRVKTVCADKIVINSTVYELKKFMRSNASTCINQRPRVSVGQRVKKGEIIADGMATKGGELALGRNVLVAFMPWRGYNFEDAILISRKIVKENIYTSIHIEEFEIESRDTRLGSEEITQDIPNVGEEMLNNLDAEGIIRVGAEVVPGDILVGKVSPKSETELSPEERLLRAIFGEKASDVRDASLVVPPGVEGIVVDARVFSRRGVKQRSKEELKLESVQINEIKTRCQRKIELIKSERAIKISKLLVGQKSDSDLIDEKTRKKIIAKGRTIQKKDAEKLKRCSFKKIKLLDNEETTREIERLLGFFDDRIEERVFEEKREVGKVKRGDELPPGVIKKVVVHVASKRAISVGDKMAGRHGNKGVIAKILPEEDMPYLPDGRGVEIVLNPLGVPSRMNVGQILETHLGWAAKALGISMATPVFDGASEEEIKEQLQIANLPLDGKTTLFDGLTGEPFEQRVTVGYIYMMKLIHLVDDKIHARSIGPYSLVTQQPLGGKAQFGGQRFGEMEVWALEAYGAAYTLQELLTVKSDDVTGRTQIYEAIVKGENALRPGTPESFNVLIKELQGLCLDVRKEKGNVDRLSSLGSVKGDANAFDAISIKIASGEMIKSWSRGEIKKPETINYRTFRPEKEGLFCEKIFGPTKDWECNCGKYKRIKYKGTICDRCGVEVTRSSVRREHMGHIDLTTFVSHVWFFKAMPSRMSALLGLSLRNLEKVLYYEEYIVVDPGDTSLKKKDLLTEEKYQQCQEEYGSRFTALMGAEGVRQLLSEVDLDEMSRSLYKEMKATKTETTQKRITKTLKIVESFRKSGNKPEWMTMNIIPVIPPDLRPLVPLEGGRFATSDLNDLYRRIINRNNRLKKLIDLNAPEIIIRNEKRMLQEAVDALFDNGRHGRAVLGPGNRPLKSLSDMLKGKQGRFRQNLLGKRVDYSGRSVIVIGPELKLHQCGLPKKMALELFEPFIIKKLRERGLVHTIKSAKRMVERAKLEVWDILEEVIADHPILLNRAPTLHRLGIQAFQPILIEGKAIHIHPLVCSAFNADFDGDQMAVHVPLSTEAQMESRIIMLSTNNIFSPSNGQPITAPSQDIVLGCYYLTKEKAELSDEGKTFSTPGEVIIAYEDREIVIHAKVKVVIDGKIIPTTAGRVLFNSTLPDGFPFVNEEINKSKLSDIISRCYKQFGRGRVIILLDELKRLGFEWATLAGISISISDIRIPPEKEACLEVARQQIKGVEEQYQKGLITEGERYNKIIDIWTYTTEKISELIFRGLDPFNPIFMMADSGARGSKQQIRQLAGMRGLMAKPSGEIIERPITANFREGLTVLEYFISTHGARKGLADTALKTADSGYLTRRLVDAAQDVIINEEDCGTLNGIFITPIIEGDEVVVGLKERILGRIALANIVNVITDEVIVKANCEIGEKEAEQIETAGIEKIRIRSVLTCEAKRGICAQCYGRNLSTGKIVELGEAVGIIAAQSIGEPGTQLTMRTFHIGGTASRVIEQSYIKARNEGKIKYHNLKTIKSGDNVLVLNRNGQVSINDESGRELERHAILQGALISTEEEGKVAEGDIFVRWDPYTSPILTEIGGKVRFEDIEEGVTIKEERDAATGLKGRVVTEYRGEYHPQIIIVNAKNEVLAIYAITTGAHIVAKDGQTVKAGDLLAKTPRKITKTKDITGGLPRVTELFEARRPKDPAIVSEIDGIVEFGASKRGQKKIVIKSPTGMKKEYLIPHGKHLNAYKGDKVFAGQKLIDGPVVPQDILRISGDKKLQEYLVNEVQEVYRLQGVRINDKHIEIIVRQMLKKVKVEDAGDTELLIGMQIDKSEFQEENEKVKKKSGKPARATPLLLGITKASLSTRSFISAASFQETTKILTDAAASGKRDDLLGLKENVIMGHLIPAGTGFVGHRNIEMIKETVEVKEEEKDADDKSVDSQGEKEAKEKE